MQVEKQLCFEIERRALSRDGTHVAFKDSRTLADLEIVLVIVSGCDVLMITKD